MPSMCAKVCTVKNLPAEKTPLAAVALRFDTEATKQRTSRDMRSTISWRDAVMHRFPGAAQLRLNVSDK